MPERRDFLAVCNDQGVPLEDFQATFCVRCVQPQCSRSRAGGLFETRVATWEERLFRAPPRMPKDDPLYGRIAAQRFIEIERGTVPEVKGPSEWLDPRAVAEEPVPAVGPRPVKGPPPAVASVPSEPAAPRPVMTAPLNTPFAQGAMLEGAPPEAPRPVDAWAPAVDTIETTPDLPAAPIVKAGAKIKFRSG